MSADLNVVNPNSPKRVLMVASNPAISEQTGWPIGFWWGELSHAYWEFAESGYQIDLISPDGGDLEADPWSDPRDESGYSADDLISLGFLNSPDHSALLHKTRSLADVSPDVGSGSYDAVFLVGGQGPMYTSPATIVFTSSFARFMNRARSPRLSVMRRASCSRPGCQPVSFSSPARPGPGSQTPKRTTQMPTLGSVFNRSGSRSRRRN